MHERQVSIAVITILFFSVTISSESFAQVPQCNGLDATLVGTENKDKIRGTSGDDVIVGLGGNDVIYGKGGNDVICGGEGKDRLFGNSGNDIILGEKDSDKLYGGQGIDTCDSSSDDKRVIGCETPYIQSIVSDTSDDLQKQLAELQAQINNMILGFSSWSDIQGIPESLADGDDDTLGNIKCDAEQTLVFDGNSWVCNNLLDNDHMDTTCKGNLVNFEGLSHGAGLNQIQEKLEPFGITLTATGNGKSSMDTVIIYNSDIDDGKDSDLEVDMGNLAIIPDDMAAPSDSAKGGQQIYEFNPSKTVESLIIVDIESDEAGTISAYDEEGLVIKSIKLPVTGNKAYKEVSINAPNAAKLVIEYNSSGGLTNMCVSEDEMPDIECQLGDILVFDNNMWTCTDPSSMISTDTLDELDCNTGEIVKMNGQDWECSEDNGDSTNSNIISQTMFMHTSFVSFGSTTWVGTANEETELSQLERAAVMVPVNGTIKNLSAKTGNSFSQSPGSQIGVNGELEENSYTMTLLVNGAETSPSLSCAISGDNEECSDTENLISVNKGDMIIIRIDASTLAPFAMIYSNLEIVT